MVCRCVLTLSVSCLALLAGTDVYAFSASSVSNGISAFSKDYHNSSLSASLSLPIAKTPISSEQKLAAVCFISDIDDCGGFLFSNTEDLDGGGNPDNYNPDNEGRCKKEGYLIASCPEGYKPGGLKCPYGDYYTKCVPACPSNYVECTEPYFGVGEACDGKYASCDCTPCGSEYAYTSIPNGYLQDGEGCLDCDGVTKYKIKINPCDGFLDCGDMGGAAGAKTCQSGDKIKYDNCKPCPNKGKYSTCPTGAVCEFEDCSGLWYVTGCKSGYQLDSTKTNCVCSGVDWCTLTSSCTALGYKQQTCNGASIKCPLDTNYSFCIEQCSPSFQYTCSGTGYAGGKGATCGGKYAECTCASGFEWKNGSCVKSATWGQCTGYAGKNCKIGDILFSDGTCASDVVSGKTPIAVVVYISSEGCGQALALYPAGQYSWGPMGINITGVPDFAAPDPSENYDSCENSKIIMAAGGKSEYPAAWAAHEYSTEGTSTGDWCLPAGGIFNSYYNNQALINAGFEKAQGAKLTLCGINWSSCEVGTHHAWPYSEQGKKINSTSDNAKSAAHSVRPVIEF